MLTMLGSILIHIVLLSEFSIQLPQLADDQQSIEIHLVELQSKTTTIPISSKQRHSNLKSKPPADAKPGPRTVEKPVAANEGTISTDSASVTNSASTGVADAKPADSRNDRGEHQENDLADTAPIKPAYTHVDAEFDVMRGSNTPAAGVTKVVFNIDSSGHYSILSNTQAKGFASLFFGNLTQKSEGSVTEKGLRPDFYSYQYGSDAKKSQTASFDWSNGVLHMHNSRGDSSVNLAADTQDFLSFMYQFMFTPPLDTMQINMTNGKRLRNYTYSFEGEEIVATKLGELKAVHLLKSSGDEEKTEIWLAGDYQYLPVKIRKTEKDGTVIEQVITSIRTDINTDIPN